MRKSVIWSVVAVLAVGVVAGLWIFQPWRAFVDRTVNERIPAAAPARSGQPSPSGPVLVASGEFVTHEHDTSGTAQLLRHPGGGYQLAIADLVTSDGPDLRVWLTDQKVRSGRDGWHVFDDGRYVELGRLKGNKGSQTYRVPGDVDVSKYRSVTIWCKRFSVSFGAAPLTPA